MGISLMIGVSINAPDVALTYYRGASSLAADASELPDGFRDIIVC